MREERLNFLTPRVPECQPFLSIVMSISLSTLRLHNQRLDELIEDLEELFGMQPITPNDSIESIMYKAGQASVVEYIKRKNED